MKQFLRNQKLSKKLLFAPLVVIIFLVILGLVSYRNLSNQRSAIENIFDNRFKAYQSGATIVKDITSVHANLYKVISWANAKYDEKKIDLLGKEQMAALERTAEMIGKALLLESLTPEEKALYQTIMNHLTVYKKVCYSAIDLATSDLNTATMFMGNADEKFQTLNRSLHDLLDLENKLSQDQYDYSLASFSWALKIFILVFVIAIGLSALISLLTARLVSRPLEKVIRGLTEGAEQMSSASGQVSQASQQVAQGAGEQASSIEETSSSLEEIASMTKQNASNAEEANRLMVQVRDQINKGKESMDRLSGAIEEIKKSSDATSKIVKTIDEIAFQTNLLALNAAVEAARAGDAGKGFAVVAEEVRNLARRASEAARNTAALIEGSVKNADQGVDVASETAKALKEVTTSGQKVSDLISEITAASKEQAQGIEQVATAVAQMNQVTQSNAANAEESASAGEELNAQVEQVGCMIEELITVVERSNEARNGGGRVSKKARHMVGRLQHATADFFDDRAREGRAQVTAHLLAQKQSKPQKAVEDKRSAQKDPKEVIPFHEGKKKDEEILRNF